jgi:hypothetical protein
MAALLLVMCVFLPWLLGFALHLLPNHVAKPYQALLALADAQQLNLKDGSAG